MHDGHACGHVRRLPALSDCTGRSRLGAGGAGKQDVAVLLPVEAPQAGGGMNLPASPARALTPERLAEMRRVADGHIAHGHLIRDHLSRNAVDAMARMVVEVLDGYEALMGVID